MRKAREQYSRQAKSLNEEANRKRKYNMILDQCEQEAQQSTEEVVRGHQLALLDTAIQHELVCPANVAPTPPSVLRPLALAHYASQQNATPGDVGDQIALYEERTLASACVSVEESASTLSENNHCPGLYGLADAEFGLSESILEKACNQIPGFVAKSHLQFTSQHCQVCNREPTFNLLPEDDIDLSKSCQRLCGRYSRKVISNPDAVRRGVDMVKTIARILASKRDIKHGYNWYLSPACMMPVLLVHTPDRTFARLAHRVTFNPLEVDWVHCKCEPSTDDDIAYEVTLLFSTLEARSPNLCPTSDSTCELAIWLSSIFSNEPGYTCELYMDYDLHSEFDHVLLLKHAHLHATADVIDQSSFQSLLETKQEPSPKQDDATTFLSVAKTLSMLNGTVKKRKGTGATAKATAYSPLQSLLGRRKDNTTGILAMIRLYEQVVLLAKLTGALTLKQKQMHADPQYVEITRNSLMTLIADRRQGQGH